MRVFARVVERRSFTLAAEDLRLPRSSVTDAVKQVERRLGVRLLQRTTRHVSPTLDGEAYYQRCIAILADVEDAEGAFAGSKPKGLLRVNVQGTLARHFILPALPEFLKTYPDIEFYMSEGDRSVDLVREGFDCVMRVGTLQDSGLIARRIATLEEATYASPSYIEAHGMPEHPDQLTDGHRMVGYPSLATGRPIPLEFLIDGRLRTITLPTTITVTAAESYLAAARLGLGLIQCPRYRGEEAVKAGELVRVLKDFPLTETPVSLLYSHSRQLSSRVRVFVDWVAGEFAKRTAELKP